MEKIVLIPAYKPEEKLTDLARKLSENGLRVVIVDDGSGESFQSVFDESGKYADVLRCEKNGGKGRALKRGIEYISRRWEPPYIIVTADADGQHKLPDILNAAEAAEKNPDSLVLGARKISRDMPTRNWFGNLYTRIAFLFAAGKLLGDTQTGLRGFGDRMVPFMLGVKGSRYEYEMNVLLLWARCNSPIEEVTINTVYEDGNSTSHFKVIRDSINIYWQIVKFSALSFFSFALDVALFIALHCLGLPVVWANIAARLVTAPMNFTALKLSDRRHRTDTTLSAARYFALAAAVLALNTLIVWGLCSLGTGAAGAKVLTDVFLFFMSFVTERKFVYKFLKRK